MTMLIKESGKVLKEHDLCDACEHVILVGEKADVVTGSIRRITCLKCRDNKRVVFLPSVMP